MGEEEGFLKWARHDYADTPTEIVLYGPENADRITLPKELELDDDGAVDIEESVQIFIETLNKETKIRMKKASCEQTKTGQGMS